MFQKLVSHNPDIENLLNKGFAVAFDHGHLVVRDIPYLGSDLKLQKGAIVSKLNYVTPEKVTQTDHQVYFAGSVPYGIDGKPIPNLAGGPTSLSLSEDCSDVVVQRSFSNKPTGGYRDLFHKIDSYVNIISGPAIDLHDEANPYTFRAVHTVKPDPIFKFQDTLTSRAEIGDLSAKLRNDVVAVIGLGGTGGYVLELLVKTTVREIRAFDLDSFQVHNAYRSPGRTEAAEFGKPKTDVYFSRYDNFRNGLSFIRKALDATCSDDLRGVTFAFVCVDKGPSRAGIFDLLMANQIPFVDVGMGLKRKDGKLTGMARVTYYSPEDAKKVRDLKLAELSEAADDVYHTNIQIGELNALNAALAVIRFKQIRGFYVEEQPLYHLAFHVRDFKIIGEGSFEDQAAASEVHA